jgi:hypothetical protein
MFNQYEGKTEFGNREVGFLQGKKAEIVFYF